MSFNNIFVLLRKQYHETITIKLQHPPIALRVINWALNTEGPQDPVLQQRRVLDPSYEFTLSSHIFPEQKAHARIACTPILADRQANMKYYRRAYNRADTHHNETASGGTTGVYSRLRR